MASLKDDLTTTRAFCSEDAVPSVAAQAAAKVRKKHGPLFVRVPRISSLPAPASSYSSVISGTSSQQSPVPSTSAKRKKKQQKIHICPHCGMQKTRKSDMDGHLATSHGIGSPRLWSFCGKYVKTKKGVKEHENKVHRKIYKHRCPEKTCKFGTQSIQLYKTHRIRHHGEEKKRSFRCKSVRNALVVKICLTSTLKGCYARWKITLNVCSTSHQDGLKLLKAEIDITRCTIQGILKSLSVPDIRNGMVPRQA